MQLNKRYPLAKIHFLNVSNGDCNIIEHDSGNLTVIDVNEAGSVEEEVIMDEGRTLGNFNQKNNPTDPIKYIQNLDIGSTVFRFILTHPDMDHLGGIKKFFDKFSVLNFWDSKNNKELNDDAWNTTLHSQEDWKFYQKLKNNEIAGTTRHVFYAGSVGKYYNEDVSGGTGDSLTILAPSTDIAVEANDCEEWNDLSYVLLFKTKGYKIIFAGDSDDTSWGYILKTYPELVKNVDVLIAPHHGRDSNRNWDFLDVLQPRLTLMGNANSEHLAYNKYSKYGQKITNNQAGDVIIDTGDGFINVYLKYKIFAEKYDQCRYSKEHDAYYIGYMGETSCSIKKKDENLEKSAVLARMNSILAGGSINDNLRH